MKKTPPSEKLEIPIRRFVTKRLIGVNRDATIQEAASRMVEFKISSIAVVDHEDVIGIVTDTDFKKKALAEGRSPEEAVHKIMTSNPVTADINTTVRHVLELMYKEKVKHILVSEDKKITGITTLKELEELDLHGLETLIARE
ncbi:CBS domain-containing protein [Rhodohalobacter sp. 8-1]|uniref:CBS domain-containing protein n=1 Tax=Rhodohalobacter sp. 8-1 TaxID=3131972 RepID=UPI0030EF1C4A